MGCPWQTIALSAAMREQREREKTQAAEELSEALSQSFELAEIDLETQERICGLEVPN